MTLRTSKCCAEGVTSPNILREIPSVHCGTSYCGRFDMPIYNTLMRVIRPEFAPFNWLMPPSNPGSDNNSYLRLWRGAAANLSNTIILGNAQVFQFQFPDLYGKEAFNYFNQQVPYNAQIFIQNQEQRNFSLTIDFTVGEVRRGLNAQGSAGRQSFNEIGDFDSIVYAQQGSIVISLSSELASAEPGGITNISSIAGYIVSFDNKDITEGFSFDIWANIDDEGSDIEIIPAQSAFGSSQARTVSFLTRYDERIVSGFQVQFDGIMYQIQTVQVTERLRTMRVNMTTQIAAVV